MIILIDGYNVLKAVEPGQYIEAYERDQFIQELAGYAKRKDHRLLLIFDGGISSMKETQKLGAVRVIYVGHGHTADDFIMRYLDEHRQQQILLVSNDRELVDHARGYGMPHIGAMTFYRFVQESRATPMKVQKGMGKVHKLVTEDFQELDALMESVYVPDEDVQPEPPSRTPSSKKLSKKQKQLNEILKKL